MDIGGCVGGTGRRALAALRAPAQRGHGVTGAPKRKLRQARDGGRHVSAHGRHVRGALAAAPAPRTEDLRQIYKIKGGAREGVNGGSVGVPVG